MPHLRRFPTSGALYDGAAAMIVALLQAAIAERGRAALALAGGSTPRGVYERLAAPPLAGELDWSRIFVYFGDERCVPPNHPSSNFRMANEALLSRVPLVPDHVFRIDAERPPADAAARYAALLDAAPPLDVVLLGMGDDGHTASLFPGTPGLDSPDAGPRAMATTSPLAPTNRVSLTLRAINESRDVLFLVSGAGKAARLAEVLREQASGCPTLPAARVHARSVTWLVDSAANPAR